METDQGRFNGTEGEVFYRSWRADDPRHVVLLAHGYAEHIGRYEHVAATLVEGGAAVFGLDHLGHGQSAGDRVVIETFDHVVDDLHEIGSMARSSHPELPVVLVGHSMGGLIATLYAEEHGEELNGLVLSAPVLGEWATVGELLRYEEIPETPIDPDTLSRDPEVGRDYAEDPLNYRGAFKRPTLEALRAGMAKATEHADRITLPVLYLHGEEDELVPLQPSREAVEGFASDDVERHFYPGARHEVFNETNSDEVLGHVRDFIERVTSR
ncbi:MAG: lysophospholipase [Egibacteraceae bacterium]